MQEITHLAKFRVGLRVVKKKKKNNIETKELCSSSVERLHEDKSIITHGSEINITEKECSRQ